MREPISVLVVDDHQVVRQGLRAFLASAGDLEVVGEAGTAESAVASAAELAPDVVLLDLVLPGAHGMSAVRGIKQASPRSQVVVLTSFDADDHVFPALRAGALSYLLKDADPEQILAAVRCAARGEAILHPRVAARLVQDLRGAREDPSTDLSAREREVLACVAGGASNREIAEKLGIGEKTVKSHVSNILGKLHLADRTQAAIFAWREGLMPESVR
jgi:DNA-binding NarL/FixJ family response regulator